MKTNSFFFCLETFFICYVEQRQTNKQKNCYFETMLNIIIILET